MMRAKHSVQGLTYNLPQQMALPLLIVNLVSSLGVQENLSQEEDPEGHFDSYTAAPEMCTYHPL